LFKLGFKVRGANPCESLAEASLWADENRRALPKTAPWHYVAVPLDEPRYDRRFSGDVSAKGCIADKVREFRATLKDPIRRGKAQGARGSHTTTGDRNRRGGPGPIERRLCWPR